MAIPNDIRPKFSMHRIEVGILLLLPYLKYFFKNTSKNKLFIFPKFLWSSALLAMIGRLATVFHVNGVLIPDPVLGPARDASGPLETSQPAAGRGVRRTAGPVLRHAGLREALQLRPDVGLHGHGKSLILFHR